MSEICASCDVSILVVAYNSQSIIGHCLSSIPTACTRFSYEILMVDNGDGETAQLVAKSFPEVMIVPSRGNVGFAAGNNLLAAKAKGRFFLLLNPDVVLMPEAIDLLLDATSIYGGAAAWGGVTLDREGRPDLGNTVHIPSLREMVSRVIGRSIANRNRKDNFEENADVRVMSGSFVMFSREAWGTVGGLDEGYFLYCEEVDMFYRLARRGYRFWRIGQAQGFHDIGHGEALSATRMLYRAAGNMQFARNHWPRSKQEIAFLLTWTSALERFLIGRLIGRWAPRLRQVGECHRDIVFKPWLWRFGYDPVRGLKARLDRSRLT